ncbi:dnaJ homolog subfamily C member 9-like isoform X2 [Seriola aureovittata]|uniref:dnaJ homolog subfamily C member 9-like isoform X2 n=1 Tax=Seriola aureovittata TaxID=2871759 RepID=UPI0024BE73A7|nr:dnaJ homolog subfamily C member 9-like isoform X2 [Seriola aureovittata]
MGLLEDCRDLFGSSDLYEVLGVPLSSSEAEVRRGYYKTSLQVHPDRAPQDPQATSKFQVTLQDIVNFEQTYNGSDEEQQDLLRLYRDCSGDMDQILDSALCCGPDDEPRVRHILQAAIDGGDLPALRAFTHENRRKKAARKRKADTERAQSEQLKKELSLDEVNDLSSVVKRRAASREASFSSLISSMEEKYCNNKPAKKKKK